MIDLMTDIVTTHVTVALVLFLLGLYCVLSKRNLIKIVIGIEVMNKAVILNFITAGYYQNNLSIAQAIVVTVILIDAVVVAVLFALIVNVFRHNKSIFAEDVARLKG
jgi:NADH:ubiquinone oxidoreductase subunit K